MFETINSLCWFCLLLIFGVFAGIVYQCVFRCWFYFSERNVKFVRGIPLLGSAFKSILGIEPAAIAYRRCYECFPKEKFLGIFDFCGRPSFLIRDPDLAKQILTTDSDHFADHKITFDNVSDYFAHTIFGSKSFETKTLLNSALSGNRLQVLHSSMVKISEQSIRTIKDTNKIAKLFDSNQLFSKYANDIIVMAVFGIELNSIRDRDSGFFKSARSLTKLRYSDELKFLASLSHPALAEILEQRIDDKHINLLRQKVNESIEARRKQNIVRNDMIGLLIRARDGQLQCDREDENEVNIGFAATQQSSFEKSNEQILNWSDDDIVTQSLLFFLSEFSVVSNILCFMFHELAINPDIQNKLFTEIVAINNELNTSRLTYEMIPKMKYLDMVVCETLRRWSPTPFMVRTCNHPYVLQNATGEKIDLQIGDGVCIPTYALHMDEKHFPKPIKFDPERFNNENQRLIKPGSYLPFGAGPRNFVGSRFTLIAVKTIAFHLLSEFHVDRSYKTEDPVKLKALPLRMDAETGFFIELRRRYPDRTPYKSQVFT